MEVKQREVVGAGILVLVLFALVVLLVLAGIGQH
jgi:hypothetical protein